MNNKDFALENLKQYVKEYRLLDGYLDVEERVERMGQILCWMADCLTEAEND